MPSRVGFGPHLRQLLLEVIADQLAPLLDRETMRSWAEVAEDALHVPKGAVLVLPVGVAARARPWRFTEHELAPEAVAASLSPPALGLTASLGVQLAPTALALGGCHRLLGSIRVGLQ